MFVHSGHRNVQSGKCRWGAIADVTAQRIAGDADIWRIILDPATSQPLNVGRAHRLVPTWLRKALHARDRGCRFPGCENRRFLDAHHVHHWARGGPTTLGNLVLLCRRHHRLVHEGGYSVDADGNFNYPWGQPFPAVPSLPRGQPDQLVERNRELAIDRDTCESGTGERIDLAYTLDVVLHGIKWARGHSAERF